MELAARAARAALADAGCGADAVDSIAVIRLFSDSAPAWKCPFGGSNNPPESVARRLGIEVRDRLYSNAGGTQPMEIMAELLASIAAGERSVALLVGAEAIASERLALRLGLEENWREEFDLPLDSREYSKRFACRQELESGMSLPVHYYALIETRQAMLSGRNEARHRQYMAGLFAPFSAVAAANPYSFDPRAWTPAELAETSPANYPVSYPYTRRLVASDAVNQGAALVLTSVGKARELGIPENRLVAVTTYAEGTDHPLLLRPEPARSEAMWEVLTRCRDAAGATPIALTDIYSCFPSAVTAACDALGLATDGSDQLTVTGGLPYFGGPGNAYSLFALAESATRLRGGQAGALVTANGGILSSHAAAVLKPLRLVTPEEARSGHQPLATPSRQDLASRPAAENPAVGTLLCHTIIYRKNEPDLAVVMADTTDGERFLARSEDPATTAALQNLDCAGLALRVSPLDRGFGFRLEQNQSG